jgi:hypothetical protein
MESKIQKHIISRCEDCPFLFAAQHGESWYVGKCSASSEIGAYMRVYAEDLGEDGEPPALCPLRYKSQVVAIDEGI